MRIDSQKTPCIYREIKNCGKKFEFFDYSKSLSLTKKTVWEKLVIHKLDELEINRNSHDLILGSIEFFLPLSVLLIFGLILGMKK